MTTEQKLDRLASIVDSLAASVVRHDAQIEANNKQIEAHNKQIGALIEVTPKEQFAEIHATLAETAQIQRDQAKQLLTHAKLLAEHDERLERIGRHLEVLIDIVDGMIRKDK